MYKQKIQNLIDMLTTALEEAEKFDNLNDAAGRRLRGIAQETKIKLQELRQEVQIERNARKENK